MASETPSDKGEIQARQYAFPYHWLPRKQRDAVALGRSLSWGLDYLSYMSFVSEKIVAAAPQRLLDVGCGDGRLLDFLRAHDPGIGERYMGVDLDARAVAFAKLLNPDGTFEAIPVQDVGESFDCVALVETLEHIPDAILPSFLDAVRRRIAPGGCAWISVPTTAVPVSPKHYRHYDTALLERQVGAAGFSVESTDHVYRVGPASRFLQLLLTNPLYSLEPSFVSTLIWRLHRRMTYDAPPGRGLHLVARVVPS